MPSGIILNIDQRGLEEDSAEDLPDADSEPSDDSQLCCAGHLQVLHQEYWKGNDSKFKHRIQDFESDPPGQLKFVSRITNAFATCVLTLLICMTPIHGVPRGVCRQSNKTDPTK